MAIRVVEVLPKKHISKARKAKPFTRSKSFKSGSTAILARGFRKGEEVRIHRHTCDCGNVFLCESRPCGISNKQSCEECEDCVQEEE